MATVSRPRCARWPDVKANRFGRGPPCGRVALWRRWVLTVQAPLDDFLRLLQRGLVVRGVHVEEAKHFAMVGRGFGTRAYLHAEWVDEGLALTAKLKSGLFGSPAAMERIVRESAEEAAAKLAAPRPAPTPGEGGPPADPAG